MPTAGEAPRQDDGYAAGLGPGNGGPPGAGMEAQQFDHAMYGGVHTPATDAQHAAP